MLVRWVSEHAESGWMDGWMRENSQFLTKIKGLLDLCEKKFPLSGAFW